MTEEYGGIDVEALVAEANAKVFGGQSYVPALTATVHAVLSRLAEDGRLGVEREYADLVQPDPEFRSFDAELFYPTQQAGADRFRYVGRWLPAGDQSGSEESAND